MNGMKRVLLFSFLLAFAVPLHSFAAAKPLPFEVSGWIPYWRVATGTADAVAHMGQFTSVMPFGFVVQNDGTINDNFGLEATSSASAQALVASAHAAGVRVVPTVMWSNSAVMYRHLRSAKTRVSLEVRIAKLARDNGFDGIDIDFENKTYETGPYFSLFLKGLYARMGPKWVYCAIEPRTPPYSAFDVIPDKLQYVNDYTVINKYCDRVEIMAYDQGTADLRLNAAAGSSPYVPVSDPQWVKKVITLASGFINKKKLIIGVPTYGYEYELNRTPTAKYGYTLDWAFDPGYATTLASELGITPTRNSAGELSFVYTPTSTPQLANAVPTPDHIVWWSDAGAIADKIQLAKDMGVRGIAIFKIDGGEDPNLWSTLAANVHSR